ncbi:PREDICTED: synaptotagmin-like protein 5 [Acropora digitifera]|uniref:synaptotagmin-like protein 5 n=1 Tax=Acropora digitifera TaxID=70779 RepID=UPI00077ABEBD|nr:PREDICTED: synaptotagmin-like protein 5 [Acropora digitifera]
MMEDIYIDVNYLTESERDAILQVLARDEELRKQEKRRISKLKNELDEIKSRGASEEDIKSARVCARCRTPFGVVFNTGALCPKCEARVCKECRKENKSKWLCVLCEKIREVRAESGAWFFEEERKKRDRPRLFGSALLRASLRRAKLPSYGSYKESDPGSPPVITQMNLERRAGGLHRPVPVHMSSLAEKGGEEENDQMDEAEVNQNYKQYAKATQVARTLEEEQSDEQEKGSFSSCISTPRGSLVEDVDVKASEEADEEVFGDADAPEDTIFDHLPAKDYSETESEEVNVDKGMIEGKEDDEIATENDVSRGEVQSFEEKVNDEIATENDLSGEKEEVQSFEEKVNNWEIDQKLIEDNSEVTKTEDNVEVISSWHQVAHEWTESGPGNSAQDTQSSKELLNVRPVSPDSETTGEFFTPAASPFHSGPATPALSDRGQSEGETGSASEVFVDAGDATPIEGGATPVIELSEKDGGEENAVDGTVTQPEITCESEEPDDGAKQEEDHRTPIPNDDTNSVDQAFAFYGKENPHLSHRTLQDQLNILSMVSSNLLYRIVVPVQLREYESGPLHINFKIGFDEMLTRSLWLTMWNHDTFGHNDFLGEVMLPLDTYQESGFSWDDPTPNWYPLHERRVEPSLMTYCGDLTFSLMFEPEKENQKDKKKKKKKLGGKLHIKLKEARNLPAKDSSGFSDPFVKSYLLPDTSKKTKQKTHVVKKNLNPVWDFYYTYGNQTLEELRNRVLELTVWDYDRGSSNDFLGGLRLGLGNKSEPWDDSQGLEIQAWQLMLDRPNQWHEYTLNLRSSMNSQTD